MKQPKNTQHNLEVIYLFVECHFGFIASINLKLRNLLEKYALIFYHTLGRFPITLSFGFRNSGTTSGAKINNEVELV